MYESAAHGFAQPSRALGVGQGNGREGPGRGGGAYVSFGNGPPSHQAAREVHMGRALICGASQHPVRSLVDGIGEAAQPLAAEQPEPPTGHVSSEKSLRAGEEGPFRGQHAERRMVVQQIAHERRAAAVRAADEDRMARDIETPAHLRTAERDRPLGLGRSPDGLGPS